MRVNHLNHQRRGHCGWLTENVDATDHPIDSIRKDFNKVIKRLLDEGMAFDAIFVDSYAHRYHLVLAELDPRATPARDGEEAGFRCAMLINRSKMSWNWAGLPKAVSTTEHLALTP
jgi:hypothetical protein